MGSNLHRNALFSFLSALFRLSANAVLFVLVARFYGPEGFGQFTTAHTLATIFILFADFGFDLFLTTEIAQHPEKSSDIVPRMAAIKLFFASLAGASMVAYGLFQNLSSITVLLVYVFCLYMFFSALLNFVFAFFRAREKMQHESSITLIMNLVLVIVLVSCGVLGVSLFVVALAFVGSRILGLVLAFRKSKEFVMSFRPVWDAVWFSGVWKKTSIFGVYFIFGNLFFMQDTILLSAWKGDHEVGIYQSVFRLIMIALILSDIAVTATIPSLSRFYNTERSRWYELGSFLSKVLYFIGLLIGLFLIMLPETIIQLAYGSKGFQEAIPILRIFGFVVIVRYAFEVSALALTTSDRQSDRMKLVVFATILNFSLNSFAIPRYGLTGAAVASLITNFGVGVGYALASRRDFSQEWFSVQRIVPVIIGALCLLATGGTQFAEPFRAIFTAFGYLVAVYFVGFSSSERTRILHFVSQVATRQFS